MATELAVAYLSLVPSASGLRDSIRRELGDMGGAGEEAGDAAAGGFGGKFMAGIALAGAAAGALLAQALATSFENERLNDRLAAQLGLNAADSARLGEVAGNLYAGAYGESLEQVNDAVGAVTSSLGEMSSADLESLSAKALDLSATFGTDVAESVGLAGGLIRNGLVNDADEAFDLITAGMQSVPAAMRDEVLPIMEEYGVNFADLGLSGEEAMGLIVSASAGGTIAMDKVGDALKELTIRGTDMSASSVAAYEAAGLSAEDMSAALLAGGDTAADAFDQIVGGLLAIEDPTEQANAAIALMGTPLEDLGVGQIPDFLAGLQNMEGGMGDVEGAAAAMGDTLNDNAATRIEAFKRQALGTLVDFVGTSVIPAFDQVKSVAQQVFGVLFNGDFTGGPFEEDSAFVNGLFTAREAIEGVVTWVRDSLWPILQQVGAFIASNVVPILAGLGAALAGAGVASIVGSVMAAVGAVSAFIATAGGPMAAVLAALGGPVTLLVVGIAALAAGVVYAYQNFEGFRNVVDTVMTEVTTIATEMWPQIQATFQSAVDAIRAGVEVAFNIIQAVIAGVLTAVQNAWALFGDDLLGLLGQLWESVQTIFGAALNIIQGIFETFAGVFTGDWGRAWDGIKQIFTGVWDAIKTILAAALAGVRAAIGVAVQLLQTVWAGFLQGLRQAWDALWSAIRSIFNAAWVALRGAYDSTTSALRGAWETFTTAVRTAWQALWDAVRSTFSTAWSALRGMFDAAVSALRAAWDTFTAGVRAVWQAMWDAHLAIFNAVWGALRSAYDSATGALGAAWDMFTAGMRAIWQGVWDAHVTIFSTVWGALRGAFDTATGALRGVWDTFTDGIRDAWDGMWSGIRDGFAAIRGGLEGALIGLRTSLGNIWDGVRGVLAAPINWVISNVINGGLIDGVNQVSRALGAGNIIDSNVGLITFHEGGVVGQDGRMTRGLPGPGERLIKVKDGEEVLTADNPRHRNRMGDRDTLFLESDVAPIGGPFDWVGDVAASAARAARDLIADMARPILNSLLGPIEGLASRFGAPGEMVAGGARRLVDSALDWMSGVEDNLPAGGSLDGTGWQAIVNFMRESGVPHVVTSTYRSGDPGAHGSGRAADLSISGHNNLGYGSSGLRAIWEALSGPAAAGQISQMILAGAPQTWRNYPSTWKTPGAPGNHWNHVHAATFDQGGTLAPGWNTILNATGGLEPLVPPGSDGPDMDYWDAVGRRIATAAARQARMERRVGV